MTPYLPKSWFKQSIELVLDNGNRNIYGDYENNTKIKINNVLAQISTSFTGTNNSQMTNAVGTFFIANNISFPIPKLDPTIKGQVIYNGKAYAISSININLVPETNQLFTYEIEVNNIDNSN